MDGSLEIDEYVSHICLQPDADNPSITHGSEDCLYLNVWVPGGVYGEFNILIVLFKAM